MESRRAPSLSDAVELSGLAWSFVEPTGWARTRDPRAGLWGELFDEQAVVHGPRGSGFYVRANLVIPVLDDQRDLTMTVWMRISGEAFERMHVLWDDPRRVEEPACRARLCNRVPTYPDTSQLAARLRMRPVGFRPTVELEPSAHPLVSDQERGITVERATLISDALDAPLADALSH